MVGGGVQLGLACLHRGFMNETRLRHDAVALLDILKRSTRNMTDPLGVAIAKDYGPDPYLLLISCLLSLRAKDAAALPISHQLFARARTPEQMLKIPVSELERMIYSIGYFRQKARTIYAVSKQLIEQFDGQVPRTLEKLLELKGVGRKTANLVLGLAFGKPAVCVDVHVDRISNRLGWVASKNPLEAELALQRLLPERYWIVSNQLLVKWGQNVCTPTSPHCSTCAIASMCPRIGVKRSR